MLPAGRWEARIGVPGSKHIYLGLYHQVRHGSLLCLRSACQPGICLRWLQSCLDAALLLVSYQPVKPDRLSNVLLVCRHCLHRLPFTLPLLPVTPTDLLACSDLLAVLLSHWLGHLLISPAEAKLCASTATTSHDAPTQCMVHLSTSLTPRLATQHAEPHLAAPCCRRTRLPGPMTAPWYACAESQLPPTLPCRTTSTTFKTTMPCSRWAQA